MLDNVRVFNYKSSTDSDKDLTFAKYMLEAGNLCACPNWRALAIDRFGKDVVNEYDFGIGSGIEEDEIQAALEEDHLETVYYETYLNDDGMPDVKRKVLEVIFIAKEEDGTRNLAIESSVYRTFAAMSQQAIGFYKSRLICNASYLGKEPILF